MTASGPSADCSCARVAAPVAPLDHFFGQVAGKSHRNADGSDRQAIIPRCRIGELLVLEHEPDNPHDINAIRVLRQNGEQIGYLEREFAGQGRLALGEGQTFHAAIAEIGDRGAARRTVWRC